MFKTSVLLFFSGYYFGSFNSWFNHLTFSQSLVLHEKPGLVIDNPNLIEHTFQLFFTPLLSMKRLPV